MATMTIDVRILGRDDETPEDTQQEDAPETLDLFGLSAVEFQDSSQEDKEVYAVRTRWYTFPMMIEQGITINTLATQIEARNPALVGLRAYTEPLLDEHIASWDTVLMSWEPVEFVPHGSVFTSGKVPKLPEGAKFLPTITFQSL